MGIRMGVVGGSDAGIEAARRCLELDPSAEVSLLVADAFPNWSICGIPYYVSGEVTTGATSPTAPPKISKRLGSACCSSTG